jgi:hypothetical protein
MEASKRIELPVKRRIETFERRVTTGPSPIKVSVGYYADGSVGEIFLDAGRPGASTLKTQFTAFALITSMALQHGCPVNEIIDACLEFEQESVPYIVASILLEATGQT